MLWGFWMILTWSFFADSKFLNSYYLAALAPPMAALCGLGLVLGWRIWRANPESRVVPAVFGATVLGGVAEALSLIPRSAGVRPWVLATTIVLTALATACVAICLFRASPTSKWFARAALGLGAAALLVGAAWASGTAVANRLGPFDSPYQSQALTAVRTSRVAAQRRDLAGAGHACRDRPGGAQHRDSGDIGPGQPRHLGHRPRIPSRGRLLRAGAEHTLVAVRRGRARRPDQPRARRGPTADPQSGPAVGPESLQPGARGRHLIQGALRQLRLRPLRRRSRSRSHRHLELTKNGQSVSPSGRQTSRNRRMAMAEPIVPISPPTMITTTLVTIICEVLV